MGKCYCPILFVILIIISSIVCEDVSDLKSGNVRQRDINDRHARSVSGDPSDTTTTILDVCTNYLVGDRLPIVHYQHHGSMEARRVTESLITGEQLQEIRDNIEDGVTNGETVFLERKASPDTLPTRASFPNNEDNWVLTIFPIWLLIIVTRNKGYVSRCHALSDHFQVSVVLVALMMGSKCSCLSSTTTEYMTYSSITTDQSSVTMSTDRSTSSSGTTPDPLSTTIEDTTDSSITTDQSSTTMAADRSTSSSGTTLDQSSTTIEYTTDSSITTDQSSPTMTTDGSTSSSGTTSDQSSTTMTTEGSTSSSGATPGQLSTTMTTDGSTSSSGTTPHQSVPTVVTEGSTSSYGTTQDQSPVSMTTEDSTSSSGTTQDQSVVTINTEGSLTSSSTDHLLTAEESSTSSSGTTDQSATTREYKPTISTVPEATPSSGSTKSPKTTESSKQTSPKPTDKNNNPEKSQSQALIIGLSCAIGAVAIGSAGGLILFFSKKQRSLLVSPVDPESATAYEEDPAAEGQGEDNVYINPAFSTTS